jgi:hypothetical protein
MTENSQRIAQRIRQSTISNPIKGLLYFGLSGALCVQIGGSCFSRKHLKLEVFVALYGGVISGCFFGLIGFLIQLSNPEKFIIYETWLQLAAYFISPLVGLLIIYRNFNRYPNYNIILLDWFIGSLILSIGLFLIILLVFMCGYYFIGVSVINYFLEPADQIIPVAEATSLSLLEDGQVIEIIRRSPSVRSNSNPVAGTTSLRSTLPRTPNPYQQLESNFPVAEPFP